MLSKWDLNRRSLGRTLKRLLADASLRQNMLRLKAFQDKVDGAAVAAKVIVRYLGARW
jgi:UDP:flavonoid glycosyltransferase YjiC (YdhE family)